MERSLIDIDVNELELFLYGRNAQQDQNLQLLADVAVQEHGHDVISANVSSAAGAGNFPSLAGNSAAAAGNITRARGNSPLQRGQFPALPDRSADIGERSEQRRQSTPKKSSRN